MCNISLCSYTAVTKIMFKNMARVAIVVLYCNYVIIFLFLCYFLYTYLADYSDVCNNISKSLVAVTVKQ